MALRSTIAANRFGLGARQIDPPPTDPRSWLLAQLESYQSRPAALAAMPARAAIAAQIGDYIDEVRPDRQTRRQAAPTPLARDVMGDEAIPENARRFIRRAIVDQYMVMVAGRMNAAATSRAPFAERLVHFWANHFAVSADKPQVIGMAGLLEFEAIRPNLMGRFADMLVAVEQHPAMLMYLDQWHSIGPDSAAAQWLARRRSQKRGLNENLAREILELHTLGVDGGYGQADVTELARALTGWTVAGLVRGPAARALGGSGRPGDFQFAPLIHQPGERTMMGRRYAQQGEAQGRAILADLAAHPSTARHLATKLARHFAGDDPPRSMIDRLAAAYLTSGGNLPAVYRAIVDSPEAWVPQPVKFKTPWEWTVSAFRMAGAAEVDGQIVAGLLQQLGQPAWKPGSPAGWDDKAASWAGPDALVRRVEAAEKIAAQAGAATDARAIATRLFGETLTASTAQAISRAESAQQGLALLLVSPEFLRR